MQIKNRNRLIGFQSEKAAQVAAYFACKDVAPISKLKLIKLLYLSERQFLEKYGRPMLYDMFFSLKDGPICSVSLNCINGSLDKEIWSNFITKSQNNVRAIRHFDRNDYDEISDIEIEALDSIWNSFGWMSASQIRNYTHKHCPEYSPVTTGRLPIHYPDVFKALRIEDAQILSSEIDQYRKTTALFSE
ncbi:MAG: Panacea domain-containing protein [Pseudomonadota bacterium]